MNTFHDHPPIEAGAALAHARAAMILVHGRGSSAHDILTLAREWDHPAWAWIAPQATDGVWYPQRFTAPLEANEPWLSAALAALERTFDQLQQAGIPATQTVLLGFSQGACLSLEYAARHPQRYGGIAGLSGGLIGPPGTTWNTSGSLAHTPVFLGCSDRDSHIPAERVRESATLFEQLGADVTLQFYPGMGHTINQAEIAWVDALLRSHTP